jgi:hypothetical protein
LEHVGWEREREKGGERGSPHSGEVAEATSQAAVSDGGRGVEIAAEVAVLKREVRGYENLVITAWPENCTVVAYAEGYGFASAVKGITYVFDEGLFAHRFGLSSH